MRNQRETSDGARRIGGLLPPAVLAAAALLLLAPAAGAQWYYGIELAGFWAPPGDTVGTRNTATVGGDHLDPRGSRSQLAEDTGLVDGERAWLWFDYGTREEDGGRYLQGRGRLSSDDQAPAALAAEGGTLADHSYEISYFRLLHYDDPSSDDPYLPDPFSWRLDGTPRQTRQRAGFRYARRLGDGLRLEAGYEALWQDGTRRLLSRSLLQGFEFATPGAADLDLWTQRAYLGAHLIRGAWTFEGQLDFQSDGGEKALAFRPGGDLAAAPGTELRRADDLQAVNLRLGSSYRPSPNWLVLGSYGYRQADADPEIHVGPAGGPATLAADDVQVDLRAHTGLLGMVANLLPRLRLQATSRVEWLDRTGVVNAAGADDLFLSKRGSSDEERTRQVHRLRLSWARSPRARYQASYRFERSDEDHDRVGIEEYMGGNVLVRRQTGYRDRTVHEPVARSENRLGPIAWTNRLRYRHEEVSQRDELERQYALGDRDWSRFGFDTRLRARPLRGLQVEAGYEAIREEFSRDDIGTVSDWDADRLFGIGTWNLSRVVTIYTTFHIGWEDYGIAGPLPAGSDDAALVNPVEYRARTYRLSPGLSLSPGDGWSLEGHYERVRNRESVANDGDRWFARVSKQVTRRFSASALYRRYQFTAYRGDDYEADLYLLSLAVKL